MTFLTEDGGWTDDISQAWHFSRVESPSIAKERFNLKEVELYYSFKDEEIPSEWDFAIPLV